MRTNTLCSLALLLLSSTFITAQELNLPRKSPRAGTSYTIGYTEVSIQYSSPAVQEREIWGGLVPYGEVWRAGANEATTIGFNTDVEIEGQTLPAGKYAFFIIPREAGKWTAIFSKTWGQWGADNYNQSDDALRVEVDAQFSKKVNEERLRYEVIGQNVENGYILLSWEKLRLYLRVKTSAMQQAVLEITTALAAAPEGQKWRLNAEAADFLLWVGQPGPALQYAQESIRQKSMSRNHWVWARILAAQEDYAGALEAAKKAEKLARDNPEDDFYENQREEIERLVKEWKGRG